ncbi:MAG: hypothetical protein ACXVBW_10180, partial [Bdellovibrionota bacterium]
MRGKFLFIVGVIAAAGVGLSGCGDPFARGYNYVPAGAFANVKPGQTDLGLGGTVQGDYTCPNAP